MHVSNSSRHHLEKAVTYMQLNYKERLTLSMISKHVALNPEYFCRLFKKHMGFTFLEYLNQIRLIKIYDDLLFTNHTIMIIIERHGFSNYKVFSRLFKESYGCRPSELRKSEKKILQKK